MQLVLFHCILDVKFNVVSSLTVPTAPNSNARVFRLVNCFDARLSYTIRINFS